MKVQVGENQSLAVRENIKNELLEIKTIEDGVGFLNKLKTVEVWVKAEKRDAELQNLVAEQKLRTQRILGDLIKSGQESGEIADQGDRVSNVPHRNISTLSQIGISRKDSASFQQIASIPQDDFEEFIEEKKDKVNHAVAELTTAGAVRLAKSLKQKGKDIDTLLEINEEIAIEKELKELSKTINMKYTKDQRKQLIGLIKI